jgi:hypothetical protein
MTDQARRRRDTLTLAITVAILHEVGSDVLVSIGPKRGKFVLQLVLCFRRCC